MAFFTVFTSTYNRGYILPELYQSLCAQTYKNFEWLIVDDGSTDHTRELVEGWKRNQHEFEIQYYYVDNGGKPRAINYGVGKAQGVFFIMVDSDDTLTDDALAKMHFWCNEIRDDQRLIGVGAARGYRDGRYIKGVPPCVGETGYIDATNLERGKYNLDADMCEAYKTELFRKYPMATWPGEKFAPEQIALNEIALHGYMLRWHKDIIYICEYLEDGLTKGWQGLERRNPMGYAMMYNHMLKYPGLTWKQLFYAACQCVAMSFYGKNPSYIFRSNKPLYTLAALPAGIILSFRRKRQLRICEDD